MQPDLYDVNRLSDIWDKYLTPDDLVIEGENVSVFNGSYGNLVMNTLNHISESYEGDEGTYNDEDGDEIVSLYRHFSCA